MKIDECKLFIDIITQVNGRVWTRKKLQKLRKLIMKGKKDEIIAREKDNWKSTSDLLQGEDFHEES